MTNIEQPKISPCVIGMACRWVTETGQHSDGTLCRYSVQYTNSIKTWEITLFVTVGKDQRDEYLITFSGNRSDLENLCLAMTIRGISLITKEVPR